MLTKGKFRGMNDWSLNLLKNFRVILSNLIMAVEVKLFRNTTNL